MSKQRIIELATYVIVASAIWIISPIIGKPIDSFFFKPRSLFAKSRVPLLAGLFLALMGTILAAWTIVLFKTKGDGTPNPKLPPRTLITSGPYRLSRNPMALGGFLVLLGEALVYTSPSLLVIGLLFGAIVYLNAKYIEEPELRNRFGTEYEDYQNSVARCFPNLVKR